MNSVDELKQRLIGVCNSLQQNVIDAAINEWRKQLRACVHADGQHFEHLVRARGIFTQQYLYQKLLELDNYC